ncbi:hypothetical protein F01_410404 [Burkholderia cenocepacia]|nr:hypothetical protein F01_410404 [Burkholderia cenocepacia]
MHRTRSRTVTGVARDPVDPAPAAGRRVRRDPPVAALAAFVPAARDTRHARPLFHRFARTRPHGSARRIAVPVATGLSRKHTQ